MRALTRRRARLLRGPRKRDVDKSGVCRTAVECDERSEHKSALARAFSTRLWVVYFLSRRRRGRRPPASQVVTRHSGAEEDPKDSRFVLARSRRAGPSSLLCVGASQPARSGGPRLGERRIFGRFDSARLTAPGYWTTKRWKLLIWTGRLQERAAERGGRAERAYVPARRNRRRSSRYPRVASTRQTPTLRKQEAQRRKQPPRWSLACASIARQEKPPQFRPPPVLSSYPGPDKAHPLNRRIEAMSASRDARAES